MALLDVKHIQKVYTTRFAGNKIEALRDVSFSVEEGEFVAIMGESGSGKTTLLNILASLDKPTKGIITLNGKNMNDIPDRAISAFRRDHLGFIFQDFNLLDTFSNEDNIYLPLVLAGHSYKEMRERLVPLAETLKITPLLDKYPYEISGGQKQRVAVARALITNPQIVFADEPTGALDSKSSEAMLKLLENINQQRQTILMVTHSIVAASYASRLLFIRDGVLYHQLYRGELSRQAFRQKISDSLTVLNGGGENHV